MKLILVFAAIMVLSGCEALNANRALNNQDVRSYNIESSLVTLNCDDGSTVQQGAVPIALGAGILLNYAESEISAWAKKIKKEFTATYSASRITPQYKKDNCKKISLERKNCKDKDCQNNESFFTWKGEFKSVNSSENNNAFYIDSTLDIQASSLHHLNSDTNRG